MNGNKNGGENWRGWYTSTKWDEGGGYHGRNENSKPASPSNRWRDKSDGWKESEWSGWSGNEWKNNWGNSSYSNDWKKPVEDEEDRGWGPPTEGNLHFQPGEKLYCTEPHAPQELHDVLDLEQRLKLKEIWDAYHDDLDRPKLDAKPILKIEHLKAYHHIVMTAVQEMANIRGEPLCLDQATISATTEVGHKRHADNLVFGVWRYKERVVGPIEKEIDQARRDGAEVWWKPNTTSHRNYAMTINLVDPEGFQGGEVCFYRTLGAYEPYASYKAKAGSGVCFCGCHHCIHAVTGVTEGFRLCLLIWTRAIGIETPIKSKKTHYHRPGTGNAVWLTLADLPPHIQDLVCHPKPRSGKSTTCMSGDISTADSEMSNSNGNGDSS